MKIHNCVQGTREWALLRAGIPTASEFERIVTPTGKVSAQAESYMCGLIAERIMGHPRKEFMSAWMERGNELEADAALFYRLQRDEEPEKVGFITNDAGTIGASPDRLIGDKGLLEIKCPSPDQHVRYLLYGSVAQAYFPQVQGQLWIAEKEWLDILSYHPEIKPALIRVERDEKFIATLSRAVTAFAETLEQQYSILVERGLAEGQTLSALEASVSRPPRLAPLDELVANALKSGMRP